jgi:hypothetical protein
MTKRVDYNPRKAANVLKLVPEDYEADGGIRRCSSEGSRLDYRWRPERCCSHLRRSLLIVPDGNPNEVLHLLQVQ